jgi:hypothetical protein
MQIEYLIERLKKASFYKSLRTLASDCDVSHEVIRKLLKAQATANITFSTYDKIDKGLLKHGF